MSTFFLPSQEVFVGVGASRTAKMVSEEIEEITSKSYWIHMRDIFTINILVVVFLKFLFSIIPGVNHEAAWSMTNICYNLVTLSFRSSLFLTLIIIIIFR